MATVTNQVTQSNYVRNKINTFEPFIGVGYVRDLTFTASGADIVLPKGTLCGKIAATGLGAKLTSAAVNGSQIPYGFITDDITVVNGTTVKVPVICELTVDAAGIVLQGADTLNTVINGQTIEDLLYSSIEVKVIRSTNITL